MLMNLVMTLPLRRSACCFGFALAFAAPVVAFAETSLSPTPAAPSASPTAATPASALSPAPTDTLEQPYGPTDSHAESNSSVAAVLPPNSSPDIRPGVVAPADNRPRLPIRRVRHLALTGEVGWNGLAGFGAMLTYHAAPHVALDLGGGLSLTGWKAGARVRLNLLEGPLTPFIGVGLMGTSGFGEVAGVRDDSDPNAGEVTLRIGPSAFVQSVLGIDFTGRKGFTMIGCLGYAHVLNHNLDVVAGTPTSGEKKAFDIVFGSGLVLTLATGYSF